MQTEQPHHAAARQRTPEETWAVFIASLRRAAAKAAAAQPAGRR